MTSNLPHIIYSESTPNPSVMKFVSNKILTSSSKECLTVTDSKGWPLLEKLFLFPFINEIFISSNYISIKKIKDVEWEEVANQVRSFIQTELNNNTIICSKEEVEHQINNKPEKTQFAEEVESVINKNIRPNIQMDGGDIELFSVNNGVVKVFLKGACSGCPSSQMTLKNGIEFLLKKEFPNKINEVIAINS